MPFFLMGLFASFFEISVLRELTGPEIVCERTGLKVIIPDKSGSFRQILVFFPYILKSIHLRMPANNFILPLENF